MRRPDRPPGSPLGYLTRVALWRLRRVLPLLVVVVAAAAVVRALDPAPPDVRAVVVLARDVDAGAPLRAADLRTVDLPAATVPEDAIGSLADATGAEPVLDLRRGTPVTHAVLATGRFAVEPPPGTVVVPLDLSAGTALLHPGDRVDVVARDPDTGTDDVLATAALVVAVEERPATGSLLGTAGDGEVVTVVAARPAEGRALVARAGWDRLGAVLLP